MTPLTPELLRKRTVVVFSQAMKAAGPDADPLFGYLVCDGCGVVVDVLAEGHPEGWTTAGDFERGFTDLCRSCSQ